jgi:hypothetical protein
MRGERGLLAQVLDDVVEVERMIKGSRRRALVTSVGIK